jgi:hypothetical protein
MQSEPQDVDEAGDWCCGVVTVGAAVGELVDNAGEVGANVDTCEEVGRDELTVVGTDGAEVCTG